MAKQAEIQQERRLKGGVRRGKGEGCEGGENPVFGGERETTSRCRDKEGTVGKLARRWDEIG